MSRAVVTQAVVNPWTSKIIRAWEGTLAGFLEVGRLLLRAKEDLPHGEFAKMIQRDLPFQDRYARMLMQVARDPRIANRQHASVLPPSPTTLYELSRLDDVTFRRALNKGAIRPDMTRAQAGALVVRAQRAERARRAAEQGVKTGVALWYVDPPWPMHGVPYKTMTLSRIRDLRLRPDGRASTDPKYPSVAEASARCSAVALWATDEYLREAEDIVASWGFTLLQPRLIWHKSPSSGPAGAALVMHEYLLVGMRGGALPTWRPPSVIAASRAGLRHSEKPAAFRDMLVKMFPLLVDRVELFARTRCEGWAGWGDQYPAGLT